MDEDILGAVHGSTTLAVVDAVLAALTSRSPLTRRLSLAAVFLSLYLFFVAALRISVYDRARLSRLASVPSERRKQVAPYSPGPPTDDQSRNYLRLVDIIESHTSVFNPAAFTDDALDNDSTSVVGVTAVVLHWKRRKGLELVLKHISRYPFIREIIVWNNHPAVELVESDFMLSSPSTFGLELGLGPPKLRIYNSPSNMHDMGKHLSCSLASYRHCYFNDDDWLNVYMDSLYTKYLECCAGGGSTGRGGSGGRIASNTMPIIHLEHRRWRFDNPNVNMHTGFTWLGTGSFAPRHLSKRFISQQSAVPRGLTTDQALVADMFFSLWTNNYPEQMSNNLVQIDVEGGEVGWSRGEGVDQWAIVYANILDGIRKLYDVLALQDRSLTPDPFPLSSPPLESHTRAPCANDGCLFVTSITPFPHPSSITYEYSTSHPYSFWKPWLRRRKHTDLTGMRQPFNPWQIESIKEYEAKWNEVDGEWPTDSWWTNKGSWHLAVDGRGASTCWESWQPPEEFDYFGLTLVAPRVVKEITIVGSRDLEYAMSSRDAGILPDSWELLTAREDGSSGWDSRRLESGPKTRPVTSQLVEVVLPLHPIVDLNGASIPIRKFKLVSRGRKRSKLTVCSFTLDSWKI